MTSVRSFTRDPSQPTVKCSACAAEVQLLELTDHRCPSPVNVTHTPFTSEPSEMEFRQPTYYSQKPGPTSQRQRPLLPKLDSSVTNRTGRGLGPKEAASIAHDLGLPSPVSAGGGRRSPRPHLSRKGSNVRIPLAPPSPELPLSQDCAFPPFPMSKPKRSNTQKEIRSSAKARSASRANTLETTMSRSASSSMYSTSSGGFARRRLSDTSSQPASRHGNVNEALSPTSTAPSSPRTSFDGKASGDKLHSLERTASEGTAASSQWNAPRGIPHEASIDRMSPPHIEQPPAIANDDATTEFSDHPIPSPQTSWMTSDNKKGDATFETILTSGHSHQHPHSNMIAREPAPWSNTTSPLDQPHSVAPEFQFAAIGARPANGSAAGSLGRTLTTLFSRKRSQSASSKKAAKLDVNSPRMKALAPEPPPIPQRGQGEFGISKVDGDSYFSPKSRNDAENVPSSNAVVSPLTAAEEAAASKAASPSASAVSPLSVPERTQSQQERHPDSTSINSPARTDFEFNFDGETDRGPSQDVDREFHPNGSHAARNVDLYSEDVRTTRDLHRASIDSASSYGSVRFSQQTVNSDIGQPPGNDMRNQISAALRDSSASFDLGERFRARSEGSEGSSSDTFMPPLASHGRLSPVLESSASDWSQEPREPSSPEKKLTHLPSPKNLTAEDWSPQTSPSRKVPGPAGSKGTCRGCARIILTGQKSVSSKDGRLSGRYHKECFNCRTCQQPFATADFYVFEDQPYCRQHYHEMNDTLCANCGDGIEGQYFETFDVAGNESKKFHSRCLTCATCRVQIHEDYFEFQGRVYCERDAFRAASGPTRNPYDNAPSRPSPLVREYISSEEPSTKGRFPERRTTRLMMT